MYSSKEFELIIRIEIRPADFQSSGLSIEEKAQIHCETFLEICKILGNFHDLVDAIKSNQQFQAQLRQGQIEEPK